MIIATTGAKSNVGDHLIHRAGIQLLQAVTGCTVVSHPRWSPLEESQLSKAQAIVALGGPGLGVLHRSDKYAPLTQGLERGLPCFVLGMGATAAQQIDAPLDDRVTSTLRSITESGGKISVRDPLSARLVESSSGLDVDMTGCPVWFQKAPRDADSVPESGIREIIFTAPADPSNFDCALEILSSVSQLFPVARKILSFHAGFPTFGKALTLDNRGSVLSLRDRGWLVREWRRWQSFRRSARRLGWAEIDVSGDLDKIAFYSSADLHIGYRVHGHLDFISRGARSVLIAEDVRGIGQFEALQDPYRLDATSLRCCAVSAAVSEEVESHSALSAAARVIDDTWPVMRTFLQNLGATAQKSRPMG